MYNLDYSPAGLFPAKRVKRQAKKPNKNQSRARTTSNLRTSPNPIQDIPYRCVAPGFSGWKKYMQLLNVKISTGAWQNWFSGAVPRLVRTALFVNVARFALVDSAKLLLALIQMFVTGFTSRFQGCFWSFFVIICFSKLLGLTTRYLSVDWDYVNRSVHFSMQY